MDTLQRPSWLKKKIIVDRKRAVPDLLRSLTLSTVCQEAGCPNISECFLERHATFLILGRNCTRRCLFCRVAKNPPQSLDPNEPSNIASAVKALDLRHVVITSVCRDDLADGGASVFVQTMQEIKKKSCEARVELLIPDFQGRTDCLDSIAACQPHIVGHNIETVPRLYFLRPQADYKRSLFVLNHLKQVKKDQLTKSSLLLGLGEGRQEVLGAFEDLRGAGCDFLALGQYLKPSQAQVDVREYITPELFDWYKEKALKMGFRHVESGPYVRSSYRAQEYLEV
ncbi:MAG: lipoyl synthase [Candidatus Omnitrophota bacterium]